MGRNSEDWFTATSSPDSWDEWTFTQTVGANASNVLQDHWNSWLTDDDLDNLKKGGVNTLRIPTGFWMWIPTLPSEPYVTTGQRAQLDRVLQGLYDRDMYAVIDMHGLPGSQNGEQESGHNTTTPTFYRTRPLPACQPMLNPSHRGPEPGALRRDDQGRRRLHRRLALLVDCLRHRGLQRASALHV